MRRHYHLNSARHTRSVGGLPDIGLLDGTVAPGILRAMHAASKQLMSVHVRHALVGGLAIGAHGYPRATKDVDFLVGDEAFEHHAAGIVTIAAGVPVAVGDVAIDQLSIHNDEGHLTDALNHVQFSGDIPVLPIGALVYLKLRSPRGKDAVDVVELIRRGISTDEVGRYLEANAPELFLSFERLVAVAKEEEQDD